MTSTYTNARPPSETLSFEYDLPHAPEKVWRALTEPALLAEWLLPVVMPKFARDATFTLHAQPQPGWDGIVNCRFLEIEPHRKLSYTWVLDDIDTVVTFTLTPTTSGTHLAISHAGFRPEKKGYIAGARYGWEMMGGQLVELLARMP